VTGWRAAVRPFRRVGELWGAAGGTNMSAAISFFGILSLAPILLFLVMALGWVFDRQVLTTEQLARARAIVGETGAAAVEYALRQSGSDAGKGLASAVVGFVVLVSGATGVFTVVQKALNDLWRFDRPSRTRASSWRDAVMLRLRGIAYVLLFGATLVGTMAFRGALGVVAGWSEDWFIVALVVRVVNELVALAVAAALYYGLMGLSGGPKPHRRFMVVGALAGALLFLFGRQLLAWYLAQAAAVSAYGAAGSLVVLLMWIYFSSGTLLAGAAIARAMEEHHARRAPG
jgi:membrane protein